MSIRLSSFEVPFLKARGQALLCFTVSETESELFPHLCIDGELIGDVVQQVRSSGDTGLTFKLLRKIQAFSKIPGNRTALRRHKLLPILEAIIEDQTSSEVSSLSAELICTLLSDPPDATEEDDLLATFQKYCFEGNY